MTILPDITQGTIASSLNPAIAGQPVTFTAIFTARFATPAGIVTFLDGATIIGSGAINSSGTATLPVSSLAPGTHSITATYAATRDFAASTTASVSQTIIPAPPPVDAGFTLTVAPVAISVPIGNTAAVLVSVTALNGFNQPVELSCSGLPREVTCSFDTATLSSSGSTQLMISGAAPHDCETTDPYFISSGPTTWLGMLATSGLILMVHRRRRLAKAIMLSLALCILPTLSGCGHRTDLGVEPGSYTFTVTAKSTGSPGITVSKTIKMTAHL